MKKMICCVALMFASFFAFAAGKETKAIEPCLSGTITDASSKKPLAEVTITATHIASKTEHTFTSDNNGNFKVNALPAGNYKVKFEKDNYRLTEKKDVAVKTDTPLKLNIELINYKDADIDSHRGLLMKYDF